MSRWCKLREAEQEQGNCPGPEKVMSEGGDRGHTRHYHEDRLSPAEDSTLCLRWDRNVKWLGEAATVGARRSQRLCLSRQSRRGKRLEREEMSGEDLGE